MAFGGEDSHWSPLLLPSSQVVTFFLWESSPVEMSNGFRLAILCYKMEKGELD